MCSPLSIGHNMVSHLSKASALIDSLSPYDPSRARRTLFSALLEAAKTFGTERKILIDGDERALTYHELTRAAFALGYALKKGTRSGDSVGVLLPTGIAAVISVFALSAYGRVPTMLNFTAGLQNLRAAIAMAKVKRIVTAHRFIKLGKFEALESELARECRLLYLEDVRESL